MIKFLDLAGVTALWNKIKSTFYTKTLIDNIVNKKVDDYSKHYLTIVSLENNNTIGWNASNANLLKTISVSTDLGKTWAEKTSSTAGTILATLNTGDELWVKGSNATYGAQFDYNYFTSTGNFNVEGNIMSLIYGDNFAGQTTLDSPGRNFRYLFYNCSKLISAENLILPAITLASSCYGYMFKNCTSLTTVPETLPATTLAGYCYIQMFSGCTSLITAPTLPATTLANYCYSQMFYGCTSLTIVSELPATTLAIYCYNNMFGGCSSLTTAPELPAPTLVQSCYNSMFSGCTSLNYIKCLATDISASNCLTDWVGNVASSGTFVLVSGVNWPRGINGIPTTWSSLFDVIKGDYISSVGTSNHRLYYIKSGQGNPVYFTLFSPVAFSGEYNDLNHTPIIIDPLININSDSSVSSKVEKFNGKTVKEIIIPINTTSNAYDESDDGTISTTEIVPYINSSVNDNYLVLGLGGILKNNNIIIDSSLIGSNFNCHPSILYNNGYLLIYPTLPMNLILNLMLYLYVKYYSRLEASNNLYLWFDDFNDGYYDEEDLSRWVYFDSESGQQDWRSYVEYYLLPDTYHYRGANGYKYTGETFAWGQINYYLWKGISGLGGAALYILTNTINYEELLSHTLETDYTNHWCPYVVKFDGDYYGEQYDGGTNSHDILIAVSNDALVLLTLWVDNRCREHSECWEDWYDYVDNWVLNSDHDYGESNCYNYTGDTYRWEGVDYYLWEEMLSESYYILTDTINYLTLYEESIEADYTNTICPYVAVLDTDLELLYEASECGDHWLVKVIESLSIPGLAATMYIDHFM